MVGRFQRGKLERPDDGMKPQTSSSPALALDLGASGVAGKVDVARAQLPRRARSVRPDRAIDDCECRRAARLPQAEAEPTSFGEHHRVLEPPEPDFEAPAPERVTMWSRSPQSSRWLGVLPVRNGGLGARRGYQNALSRPLNATGLRALYALHAQSLQRPQAMRNRVGRHSNRSASIGFHLGSLSSGVEPEDHADRHRDSERDQDPERSEDEGPSHGRGERRTRQT